MNAFRLALIFAAAQGLLVLLGVRLEEASMAVAFGALLAPLYSRRVHRLYRQAFLPEHQDAG